MATQDEIKAGAQALFDALKSDEGDPDFKRHPLVTGDLDDALIDGHFNLFRAAEAVLKAASVHERG